MVDEPGYGVMRLRVAITEAEGANRPARVVTTVLPPALVLTTLGGHARDSSVVVGNAGIELELRDSLTEERLAAAVDRRAGKKWLSGVTVKWIDVEEALSFWAERTRQRLARRGAALS